MSQWQELRLKNDLSELPRVTELVERFGEQAGLAPKDIFSFDLALEELIGNIIRYAYEDEQEHIIILRVELDRGWVRIELEDDGLPYNPLDAPEPDLVSGVAARPIGGLGVHLVRELMDELDYARENGRNCFRLGKRCLAG